MIKIGNTHVDGFEAAIRGMRNPLNSWDKSDSNIENDVLGEKDLALAKKLVKAGTDHSKFMRMINVTCDITAPLYWIAEHDTYKVGTTRNSCSFMHKGLAKPFDLEDFSFSIYDIDDCTFNEDEKGSMERYIYGGIIESLNVLRELYIKTKDEGIFTLIRQLLPSGYNQRYTWQANYQVLRNIYHARKNHKLNEWRDFCKWIETLPYAKELIVGEES